MVGRFERSAASPRATDVIAFDAPDVFTFGVAPEAEPAEDAQYDQRIHGEFGLLRVKVHDPAFQAAARVSAGSAGTDGTIALAASGIQIYDRSSSRAWSGESRPNR